MQTPAQIDLQNCDNVDLFRSRIEDRIAHLEYRFGRITACRVVMRGPSEHHRTGGHYEVAIHITLPDGRQVDIERTPTKDERFGEPYFAINDAFKRARRVLQDNVRQIQGAVKLHEEQPTATVRELRREDGYSFLETSDGRDVYFHSHSVMNGDFERLRPGTRVTFAEEMGEKVRKQAQSSFWASMPCVEGRIAIHPVRR